MTDRSRYRTTHKCDHFSVTHVNNTRDPGVWIYHYGLGRNIVMGAKDESEAFKRAIVSLSERLVALEKHNAQLLAVIANVATEVKPFIEDDEQ